MAACPPIEELVARFVLMKRRAKLTEGTLRDYASALGRFADAWKKTRKTAASIDADWMVTYLTDLKAGEAGGFGYEIEDSTYNNYVMKLREFLKYLTQRRILEDPFVMDVCQPVKVDTQKIRVRLPVAQMNHAIEMPTDPWERWVLTLAYHTAGRVSEVRSRRVRHVRIQSNRIEWERAKAKRRIDDLMPITSRLMVEYQKWMAYYQETTPGVSRDAYLVPQRGGNVRMGGFRHYPDRMASAHSLGRVVKKYVSLAAGIDLNSLHGQANHIIRRTAAYGMYAQLYEDGMAPLEALDIVRLWLGHENINTTMLYIGVDLDRQRRDELIAGSDLLTVPDANVVRLPLIGG